MIAPPDSAFMLESGAIAITDIHGGEHRPGEDLDLHDVIFVDGGSQMWFEPPDILWVWHCHRGTNGGRNPEPTRYVGTWRPCTCPSTEDKR